MVDTARFADPRFVAFSSLLSLSRFRSETSHKSKEKIILQFAEYVLQIKKKSSTTANEKKAVFEAYQVDNSYKDEDLIT